MSEFSLKQFMDEMELDRSVSAIGQRSLVHDLSKTSTDEVPEEDLRRVPRLGLLYESTGLAALAKWARTKQATDREAAKIAFEGAYVCWKALLDQRDELPRDALPRTGVRVLAEELPGELLPSDLELAFRLAVAGLGAERVAEARLDLQEADLGLEPASLESDWQALIRHTSARALVLLTRKAGGWADVDEALASLRQLRELQAEYEDPYLSSHEEPEDQRRAALILLGHFHLAQVLTIAGTYLASGEPELGVVATRLDRHRSRSTDALRMADAPLELNVVALAWAGARLLVENAIWTHVRTLGEASVAFAHQLAARDRGKPVLELWPGQQLAIRQHLLDPAQRAVVVQMPTSAGKTLLAKFAIVQAKALNPQGRIAYIVPTRALVNQVTFDLRSDLSRLTRPLRVEQAIPAFELDPTEDKLLQSDVDVIVSTPEKFDLLLRRSHPVSRELALVVADEIHNLSDESRGARLELLLGTLKRERPRSRFLLLSPFVPNAEDLSVWLSDGHGLPPIRVDWKPSRKMVGAVRAAGRKPNRRIEFETLSAIDNSDVDSGISIFLGPSSSEGGTSTFKYLTPQTVRLFSDRGGVLVLCRGKGTAATRAKEIAAVFDEGVLSQEAQAVRAFVSAEMGRDSSLSDCLGRGVAFHHAGLSQEVRWLIECLISRGDVRTVCGTTTLAQGVNFPISTVIVESLKKGDADLSYEDFWNIAGRAGRTLVDSLGVVAFPTPSKAHRQAAESFLKGEASELASQLASVVDKAEDLSEALNLKALADIPSLSPFLQFLAHALKVSGKAGIADEVEDLLRASLVYHQVVRNDEAAAGKLVRLCRSYLDSIRGQQGMIGLADQTGFSTVSVRRLLAGMAEHRSLADASEWEPDRLFGDDLEPLRQRIDLVAGLPEIRLGSGERGAFNAGRVAEILRDWVGGKSLSEIAESHFSAFAPNAEARLTESNNYIFSSLVQRASWGLAALQTVSVPAGDEEIWSEIGHLPSLVFYGVRSREAVWLRMVGVPRLFAESLGFEWRDEIGRAPTSFEQVREWVGGRPVASWERAIGGHPAISPSHCRTIWGLLSSIA